MSSHATRMSSRSTNRQSGMVALWLYVPALIAWILLPDPGLSYSAAWLGSVWILWASTLGPLSFLPPDRPLRHQLFRPLVLTQGMFAGYLCLTSIFYVWELMAGGGGAGLPVGEWENELSRVAASQRYSLLGHAALVHGIVATMDYRRSGEWGLNVNVRMPRLLLSGSVGALVLMVGFDLVPGLRQFIVKLRTLAAIAAVFGFGYALRQGDWGAGILGAGLYGYVLYTALLSGWKEVTIVVVGLLLLILYPKYKRTVIVGGTAAVLVLVSVLPVYNSHFRQLHWEQNIDAETAAWEAIDRIQQSEVDFGESAWTFLSGRASTKTALFTDYIEHTPSNRPYYGLQIAEQGAKSIIPRVLWPDKPVTEKIVMDRVYENQVVSAASDASAKPSVIIDGYLSAGALGVLIVCFLLGATAGVASRVAERWFGGYELGSQVIFTGLFAGPLLTASIEFMMNSVFWSFVLMAIIATGLWIVDLLQRRRYVAPTAAGTSASPRARQIKSYSGRQ